ncbi:GHMP kinase [Jiella endophytica]|uniref:GHMP kinase n=1 Tax=Jiella endophytica TaxID=2558362 RepID=A0A4Y8RM77_9HYPH|nr:GHMP kinase [Jiella endophytica]TFF23310.1 GHMP kinase [Jiella endophytica]
MIISRSPFRISFVGGGTDLAYFYREHGGCVVSMSIQEYFYLSMHRYFFDTGYLVKYSQTERVDAVEKIQHPIIREVFSSYGISGVDFSSAADIPAGTGLGSSSSFTAALITLCDAYTGRQRSQASVAEMACDVEINRLGEPIGKQDQYGAAIGGLKKIRFMPDDTVVVEPIFLKPAQRQRVEEGLLLVYCGGSRSASAQLAGQRRNIEASPSLIDNLKTMAKQAEDLALEITRDVDVLGDYLHEGWERKKRFSSSVSTPEIDAIYERARAAGARGGKLLGAGGAGFLLFYAPGDAGPAVRHALSDYKIHDVRTDHSGALIVFNDQSR